MARSKQLISKVKQLLRERSITYQQLAERLDISESAIKHMFAKGRMSLQRLDDICEVLEFEVTDLMDYVLQDVEKIDALSKEYERELVSDMKLLLVAYCVVNFWTLDDIVQQYQLDELECVQYLAKLDRMKMIELQTDNRIKPLTSSNFKWQKHGPIERFFRQQIQNDFLQGSFDNEGQLRIVRNGNLSLKSRVQLTERMQALGGLFDEVSQEEKTQGIHTKEGTTMVLAIRNWEFQVFRDLERKA